MLLNRQHLYLLRLLVSRDISKMYRRSFLGYLWSMLNPLGIMLVMTFIFQNLFKVTVEHFPAYLISGQIIFEFVSSSTTQSLHSVVGNAPLLKKTNVPKSIFTISTTTSRMINLLFSLVALFVVLLTTRVPLSFHLLLTPIVLIQVYFFSLGIGLFLAQLAVFFRDLQYMYGIFLTAWIYASAIFYPVDNLIGWTKFVVTQINPMYFYIYQFRCFAVYGSFPEAYFLIGGILSSLAAMIIGQFTFSRKQNEFILYI